MLKANKSSVFESIFAVYNANLLRRNFQSFSVSGLNLLTDNLHIPTVIYANHSAWWDGLAAFHISRRTRSDSFIMMEEKQLAKLSLFRRLGAFSVVREDARQAKFSVDYAIELLLEKPGRKLWVFPQGEILPNEIRPIEFFNGAAHILKKIGVCRVIDIAFKYEFLESHKPEIFARIRQSKITTTNQKCRKKTISNMLADRLTVNLERLKLDIINRNTNEYQNII